MGSKVAESTTIAYSLDNTTFQSDLVITPHTEHFEKQ